VNMRLKSALVILGFLSACGKGFAPEDKKLFDEIIINGEVISSSADMYGYVTSLVKYKGKVYTCRAESYYGSKVCNTD
jgi:hypothetical protein